MIGFECFTDFNKINCRFETVRLISFVDDLDCFVVAVIEFRFILVVATHTESFLSDFSIHPFFLVFADRHVTDNVLVFPFESRFQRRVGRVVVRIIVDHLLSSEVHLSTQGGVFFLVFGF